MTRKLIIAVMLGVLVASGAYVLIYLFRWEWHRAIITGIFFLAAELALAVLLLMRKLGRIEERLDRLGDAGLAQADPAVLERLRSTAPEPSKPFAWLDPRSSTTNVFLPFLLGVGALASALAWVVENLARRTAIPVLERRLAATLAPVSLPAGGLVGVGPLTAPPRARSHPWRTLLVATAGVAATVAAAGAIDVIADAIQTRPDTVRPGAATTVDVQLSGAAAQQATERRATELWGTCSHVLHSRSVGATVEALGDGRARIRVPSDVGHHAEQRLRGCLEDAVVDRVQASVVSIDSSAR